MDKWKSKIDSVRDWGEKKTHEEEMHELMHELSKPAGLNSLIQNIPKGGKLNSLWENIKSILVVSLVIALAALVVIGSLLALPLLIVIGVGVVLFIGCKVWMEER